MIWSDICWNLSCCKRETKKKLNDVELTGTKLKLKYVDSSSLLPFAAVAFAPVEKKEKRSKSKTAKPLSFKISKKFIKLEISFQLSLHANINFFRKSWNQNSRNSVSASETQQQISARIDFKDLTTCWTWNGTNPVKSWTLWGSPSSSFTCTFSVSAMFDVCYRFDKRRQA